MPTFGALRPMLNVHSIPDTIAFYRDRLGFSVSGTWGPTPDQPTWCELTRDGASIMFTWGEPHEHEDGEMHTHDPALGGSLYFSVDDVDAVFEELKASVDSFEWEPETMAHGMREFGLTDCNGFLLVFGAPV